MLRQTPVPAQSRIHPLTQIMSKKKSILLRINPDLWQDLNAWSQDELRSLNGQIEYVLREAVRQRKKENAKQDAE